MLLKKLLTFMLTIAMFVVHIPPIQALELDPEFNPGHIISDYSMFNYNSMSLDEIQNFLEAKDSYLATYETFDAFGEMKTASEIIYEAAQRYQVSPKTILVLLQKEQSLIQNPSPEQKRLDWATGYAVCDSCSKTDPKVMKYKGFGKQVDNGAGAFRFYSDNASKYQYLKSAGQTDIINGEEIIYENQATANLYTYTPHIRGNYTFWRVWQSYFGDPLSENNNQNQQATIQTDYMAQILGSAPEVIEANEGEQTWYWVEFVNIGTKTWTNENLQSLYMIDTSYKGRIPQLSKDSTFEPLSDEDKENKIYASKTEVKPGEILRVSIPVQPSYKKSETGNYMLVIDGKGWLADTEINYEVARTFRYDAKLISENFPKYSDEDESHKISISYQNVGTQTWYQDSVYLQWQNITMETDNKMKMEQEVVYPGEIATFNLTTNVKYKKDSYTHKLNLLKKVDVADYNQFPTGDFNHTITVSSTLAAEVIDFQVPEYMEAGKEYYGRILVQNVGTRTWEPDKLVLRSYRNLSPYSRSYFYDETWISGFAIDKIQETIEPGETYTFHFTLEAPNNSNTYKHYFQLEWGDEYQEILLDDDYNKVVQTKVSPSQLSIIKE